MINLLYCFDDNYNYQAFSSIISILDKVNEKIKIFVIHKNQNSDNFFPHKIKNHKNLKSLDVKIFDKQISNFPNLFDAHVSEATYYRLFCSDYLPDNIETILYIDADIICISNPINLIKNNIQSLLRSDKVISSKTELIKSNSNQNAFNRLNMTSSRYFNAGVMNINYKKWKELDVDFNQKLNEYDKLLEYWDQDLLNHIFDGDYVELDPKLNKVIDFSFYEYVKENLYIQNVVEESSLIHFAGSHKPWSVNGIMCNLSEIYQTEFRKISKNTYHITHKIRSLSVYIFLKNLANLKFFKIQYKIYFLVELIKSLLKVEILKNED